MITLNLPYPPSVNNYWIASGRRRFISERGRSFKQRVAEACGNVASFKDQKVAVSIVLYPRNKRLMDIDNSCKAILDSLIGFLYDDDSQVWKLTVERDEVIKDGGCKVTVELYNP